MTLKNQGKNPQELALLNTLVDFNPNKNGTRPGKLRLYQPACLATKSSPSEKVCGL